MAAQQTLDVLKSYVSLLQRTGDSQGEAAVRALASAMTAAADAKIKPTTTKVKKLWGLSPELAATVGGLDDRLTSLRELLVAGGAKAASSEITMLVELLEGRPKVDPREFERLLRNSIEAPLPAPTPRVPRSTNKREPLTAAEVRQWADRLTAVTTNQSAFESELAAILAIPKLSASELKSIAERYLGYAPPSGKAAILKKVRTRQMQDAMEAGRQSRIQRIAV